MLTNQYNPDILTCLANLSSDEVFTPPGLANDMLDLLPEELWSDKNAKFLDPFTKSGVFLREIAKRLLNGLEKEIPDLQKRIDHIFHNQIYGIAITELTGLLARRSVYCSKLANGKNSVSKFKNEQGNIFFERLEHTWKNGKCEFCGASELEYKDKRDEDLETHAYQFIHTENRQEIFNMKFDVIIGNPPYQLNDGGNQASATPLYQKFITQAIKMEPRFISMVVPSRWFAGGKGLNEFRAMMLTDGRIRVMHDYIRADDVFPGVEIKGGINYFLWNRDKSGDCRVFTHSEGKIVSNAVRPLVEKGLDTFIRYNEAIPILRKVRACNQQSFASIVSSRKPFGFPTNFTSFKPSEFPGSVKIFANQKQGYISRNKITVHQDWIDKYKIFIPVAIGVGNVRADWLKPVFGGPNTCCTETYIVIGPFKTEKETTNAVSYMQTRFFHLLLSLKKISQHTTNRVYELIPLQDFSSSWDDQRLYKMYSLSSEEITFIEDNVAANVGS